MKLMIESTKLNVNDNWTKLYRCSGILAFIIALLLVGEIFVYALIPDRSNPIEIFTLFKDNPLAGLLFFDLLGMISYVLFIPVIFSFYQILQHTNKSVMTIASVLFFIGVAVFFANNTGFSVLSLSHQYSSAVTLEEKAILLASCQTMITLFDVNAFMVSYIIVSIAWTMISFVMLQSKIFSRNTAFIGIFAGLSGIIAEIIENTLQEFLMIAISFYFLAILFLIVWVVLSGKRLYKISLNMNKYDV